MSRLRYILQHRYLLKVLAIIFSLMTIVYTKSVNKKSIYKNETTFVGIVYKIKSNKDKTTIYFKAKEKLIVNDYNKLSENIQIGDTISVEGVLQRPKNNTVPNQFNYQKYLYYNDIFYIIEPVKIKKISNNTNVIYYLRNYINTRINNIKSSTEYLKIFVLGDNSMLDEGIINSYRENGISHLFSISGMHISLFASILLFFLKRVSYSNYYNYSVVILFLVSYSLIIGITPSVLRSITMYILLCINKLFNF